MLLAFSLSIYAAEGARPASTFNHDLTLFPLTGMHTTVACESCHVKGVFKGTPTGCSDCHNRAGVVNAQMKPATHIPTTQECSTCHKPQGWLPTTFSHQNLTQSCATCHNGTNQTGKPASHIATTKDCGECHKTTAWVPAGMDHSTLVPPATGRCMDCHGKNATGKPTNHVVTVAQCDTCHNSTTAWLPAGFTHGAGDTNCQSCHNGSTATGKPTQHIQTGEQCSVCHTQSGWSPTSFAHTPAQVGGKTCATCHNGTGAAGMTAKHIPIGSQGCDSCHTTAGWVPTSFDHAKVGVTGSPGDTCTTCHNGSTATGKPAGHIPTTQYPQCVSCHSVNAWKPTQFAHTGVTSATDCTTCHNGKAATGRPISGLNAHKAAPMTSNMCGSCHRVGQAWQPATMNHASATNCTSCHVISSTGNAWTPGKTAHISTAGHAQCSDCHNTTTWSPSTFRHQGITATANCTVSCHNGTNATGRPTSGAKAHTVAPMTNVTCGNCHSIGTSWIPATMNHAGITTCTTCHTYAGNSWTPAKLTHIVTTAQCLSCHTTTAWLPANFSHTVARVTAATNCTQSGCHDTPNASVPRAGVPSSGAKAHSVAPMTSTTCASCHTIGGTWTGAKMNHTGATNCEGCHSKSGNIWTVTPAQTHITTSSPCSNCHTTTAWKPASFKHDGVNSATTCTQAGCHDTPNKATPGAGRPTTGAKAHLLAPMTSNTCGSCHTIGTTWTPATMDHAGLTSCTSCHIISSTGNGFTPGKSNHISTAGHAQCSDCHATTAWKPTSFAHNGVTSADNCTTCHNGTSATARPTTGAMAHKTAPMTSNTCGSCHSIGTAWNPATMNHAGATSCTSCHVISASGNIWTTPKSNHISTAGYVQCSSCHLTSAWKPTSFNHSGVTTATNCTTCHNGTSATGRPTSGAMAHTVAPMTNNTCANCHTIGTSWTPTPMNHAAGNTTTCTACHAYTGNNWTPAKAGHVSTTTQCSSCHSTSAWLPANFSHNNVTATTNCTQSGCHSTAGRAAPQAGRPSNHVTAPMTANTCANCHSIGSTWTPWTMNHSGATNCSACHNYGGNAWTTQPATTHITTTSQCSNCHGTSVWKPATFTHNGFTSATNCTQSGCHDTPGAAVPKAGRPITGAKAHTVAPMTNATCADCHAIGSTWTPATMNHTTATNCTSCHIISASGNGFTPPKSNHISTTGYSQCSSCHTTTAWTPTAFSHSGVTSASNCTTCHNGTAATGRPTSGTNAHTVTPMTSTTCGSCHTIGTAWIPATMNHSGATACTTCHTYTGNAWTPAKTSHLSTSSQCSSCHLTSAWLPATFDHAANGVTAASNCTQAGCHDTANHATPRAGVPNTGVNAHLYAPMTSTACATCHTIGGVWGPGTRMNHTGAVSCSSCHSKTGNAWTVISTGGFVHVATTSECSSCHGTTSWLGATFRHDGVTSATNCAQSGCHNTPNKAVPGAGLPTTGAKAHLVAPMNSTTCGSCHAIGTAWTPATMNHVGLTSCTSCHVTSGNGFTPAKLNHISTTGYAQCSSCHTTTAWTPTSFKHSNMTAATDCTTCHNGTSATGRPANHATAPMTAKTCASCHTIGTAWLPFTMNHTGATLCASCHATPAGNAWTPAKSTHISTAGYAQCSSCHNTTLWNPSTFAHAGITAATNCATCHNGTSATGTPTGAKAHTVAPMTNSTCGSCHGIGTVWTPATMNHTGLTACSSCHNFNGNGFTPAKVGHIATTGYGECSSCHLTTAWLPTSFKHTNVTATSNCTTCHNGTNATGRPTTGTKAHLYAPMTSNTCGSCHTIGTAWTPATMNHTGVGSCLLCHNYNGNGFTPAKTNHIVTTSECAVCHTTAAWLPTSFAHTTAQLSGKTCKDCHNGTAATGPDAMHAGISPSPYNCDACHRTTAWLPPAFAHSGITTGCTNCHKTGFATPKTTSHFITTQSCERCHTTTAWKPIKSYVHLSTSYKTHSGLSMTLYSDCLLCHIGNNEVITGAPHRGNAAYKPDCAWCHALQYKSGSHKKTTSPTTVYYTVAELKNCSGACHQYTNNTYTTIQSSRTGHHRSTDSGF
jgi:predicted CXXCH cytochrome family protein